MIKKISMLVFACLLVASFSFAADAAKTTMTKPEASKMMKVSGTVEKMDAKTHTLTINTGTETKSYTYGSHTSYMQGTKKVKSSVLKDGDKVDVYADSKNVLHKVEIEPAAAPTTH